MRIDQIITLVWIGNAALLGGAGWAGWRFWKQKTSAPKPAAVWPVVEARGLPPTGPGALQNYQRIYTDHLSGLVPPPPEAPKPVKPAEVDPATAFKASVQILGGFTGGGTAGTMAYLTVTGNARWVPLGGLVDGWQLRSFSISAETAVARGEFWHPKSEKPVVLEQVVPALTDPFTSPGAKPFVPESADPAILAGEVPRDTVEAQAFPDPGATDEWVVPLDETRWWEVWGRSEVFEKTTFAARPEGLEIASDIPRGPLNGPRGLARGDVLISINDVEIRSVEAASAYLRGEGRGLTRYVVVLERAGARKTLVYRVARPHRP